MASKPDNVTRPGTVRFILDGELIELDEVDPRVGLEHVEGRIADPRRIVAGIVAELAARHYDYAARAIGIAVFTDGVDGRIARATGATSEFGKEIDSLADCITFGVAPAALAFAWGIRTPELNKSLWLGDYLPALGYFIAFLYLTCGAARLARFNVQKNPKPKNPGRPGRRYFVGLPIPAAAGMLAAVVHFRGGVPIENRWP